MDFSSLNPITSTALSLAARGNDLKELVRLLKKMNPNCIDNRGWTCLHEAAANDSYDCVRLLLQHKDIRPLAETHEGHTALYLACRYKGSVNTIRALLNSVEDLANYGSTENVTPLHVSCALGRIEVIQLLIDYGAVIDVQDFDGDTPLHDAAINTQHKAVAVLLHAGAKAEIRNETDYTPFHLACFKGCFETVKQIYPFITDINQLTGSGDSPLILATQGCNVEIVTFLLKNGADPDIHNDTGDLALAVALNSGNISSFKTLLQVTNPTMIDHNIILFACLPDNFKMEILGSLLMHDLGPEKFAYVEPYQVTLEQIGEYRPSYSFHAPFNAFLSICEYVYNQSPERFREFFYLFLMKGPSVDALHPDECPPLVHLHYCRHSSCFKEIFHIFREQGCDVDYCSALPKYTKNRYLPDAFLASLTSDPVTSFVLMPYSLQCDPEYFIYYAIGYGAICRVPKHVLNGLLALIDVELTSAGLYNSVFPLKHLCRQKIRHLLRKSGRCKSTNNFLNTLHHMNIPNILKNYLRFM